MGQSGTLDDFRSFLVDWNKLPIIHHEEDKKLEPLTTQALENFLSEFSGPLERLGKTGTQANLWEIAGLKRDEVRVSSVLNWFLDPLGTHGQGSLVGMELMKVLADKSKQDELVNGDFPNTTHLGRFRAGVEVCPSGLENRVDIVLDGENILLYIEVKIDAAQGYEQLKRYHELAKHHANGRKWGVIYLTPKGLLPNDAKGLKNCMAISWADIANALKKAAQPLEYGHISKHYIVQFSQYISNF